MDKQLTPEMFVQLPKPYHHEIHMAANLDQHQYSPASYHVTPQPASLPRTVDQQIYAEAMDRAVRYASGDEQLRREHFNRMIKNGYEFMLEQHRQDRHYHEDPYQLAVHALSQGAIKGDDGFFHKPKPTPVGYVLQRPDWEHTGRKFWSK